MSMRAKTYGRRKKAIPRAEITFFVDSSSPVKQSSSKESSILSEKSNNIKSSALHPASSLSQATQKKLDPIDQLVEETLQLSISREADELPKFKRVDSEKQNRPTSAIRKLNLHDSNLNSPVVRPVATQQRPASLSNETISYLEPLLNCKNVSKCVEDFQGWADERATFDISKVGEGSFGEVFRAQSKEAVILKLMPLNARKGKGSRSYTSINSAVNEITLLEKMQKIPGFVEFRGACVLQGQMATQFISLWNQYLASGRTVESKDPNKKGTYPNSQLWLLIEMSDAGRSLEPGQYVPPGVSSTLKGKPYITILRAWDIWWQTVRALAKAEVLYGFEHRDLHGGNICVVDLYPDRDIRSLEQATFDSQKALGISSSGVQVTLIDYSLSRAAFSDGKEFYYDFQKDKKLLEGTGDLQYDMYRHMASVVGPNSCKDFHPRTNLVWLYFVLTILLKNTITRKKDFPQTKGNVTVGETMLGILKTLQSSIDPNKLSTWKVSGAGDLIEIGLDACWFTAEDAVEG